MQLSSQWWHFLTGLSNSNPGCTSSITEFAAGSSYSIVFSSSGDSRRVPILRGLVFALAVATLTAQLKRASFKKSCF